MPLWGALLGLLLLGLGGAPKLAHGFINVTYVQALDIFTGRCLDYTLMNRVANVSCSNLSTLFTDFLNTKDFQPLINAFPPAAPANTTLFWSGTGFGSNTSDVAHRLAENLPQQFVTLESTLLGYSINNLDWCTPLGNSGCLNNFWGNMSASFASHVVGAANVLLFGDQQQAFRNKSYFGEVELPALATSRITSLTVLLIPSAHDNCSFGSIHDLNATVKHYLPDVVASGNYFCEDRPEVVFFLLCVSNSFHFPCMQYLEQAGNSFVGNSDGGSGWSNGQVAGISVGAAGGTAVLCGLIAWAVGRKKAGAGGKEGIFQPMLG